MLTQIFSWLTPEGCVLPQKECKIGLVGGTFSLLHRGHRHLLRYAASKSEKLIVGVTSDEYIRKNQKNHPVEPYELRALSVILFLMHVDPSLNILVVPIDDEYGPALTEVEADCIFVSEETFSGAVKVNLARKERGLKPLKVYSVELIGQEGEKLSSTTLWRKILSRQTRGDFSPYSFNKENY
ncbi:MAG: pantetheine-phosphate adenylyltransferase [Thermofilum sp.]|uniref:pantetheine-phosphate adenylyltransferase n=1 Tax=Thermofilum sp. TaxID=1961369 RepID=UPI00258A33BC|nr:pantetheine-phosphate adenylyltransferase [Thermofilum sp.]MCI4409593.1 pantetheine-phosphate adenylyltransferase [Thermofilum sp.]